VVGLLALANKESKTRDEHPGPPHWKGVNYESLKKAGWEIVFQDKHRDFVCMRSGTTYWVAYNQADSRWVYKIDTITQLYISEDNPGQVRTIVNKQFAFTDESGQLARLLMRAISEQAVYRKSIIGESLKSLLQEL
jgi:hypothetical protein